MYFGTTSTHARACGTQATGRGQGEVEDLAEFELQYSRSRMTDQKGRQAQIFRVEAKEQMDEFII